MLTDHKIQQLLKCPKKIVSKKPAKEFKQENQSPMDINQAISSLRDQANTNFDFYERRPGIYQLIVPIVYEDGDMVDIYLQDSPRGGDYVRVCDFGMAMMRLSCTYEINSAAKQKIFDSILHNNGVQNNDGNLYLDTKFEMLYEAVLQFAGCVQKVCTMRYWGHEQR